MSQFLKGQTENSIFGKHSCLQKIVVRYDNNEATNLTQNRNDKGGGIERETRKQKELNG